MHLSTHLELNEEATRDLLTAITQSRIWLKADAMVIYGSRTHKFWSGKKDVDIGAIPSRELRYQWDQEIYPGSSNSFGAYEEDLDSNLAHIFREKWGIKFDALWHWGSLTFHDIMEQNSLVSIEFNHALHECSRMLMEQTSADELTNDRTRIRKPILRFFREMAPHSEAEMIPFHTLDTVFLLHLSKSGVVQRDYLLRRGFRFVFLIK